MVLKYIILKTSKSYQENEESSDHTLKKDKNMEGKLKSQN